MYRSVPNAGSPMPDYQILVDPPRSRWPRILVIGVVFIVVVAVAGTAVYLVRKHTGEGRPASGSGTKSSGTTLAKVLTVVSSTPTTGAMNVAPDQVVTVRLSSPVSGVSGMPMFNPPVSGSWTKVGPDSMAFRATVPFLPTSTESLVLPAGTAGPHGTGGQLLAAPVTVSFTVAQASTERLQQLLAELNYLPLSFTPSAPVKTPTETTMAQPGTFAWRWPNTPTSLTSLWSEGYENVITKGAVMNFENQNGLAVDGLAGTRVWSALLADVGSGKMDANPYTYVFVTKQIPESLTLFSNGTPVLFDIAVNTGAPGADTTDGTYPVFEHVTSSEMKGTNPNGTTYDDPNVPWASYFNGGDALHGFVRAQYGFPQSNGCVEMTVANAGMLWPLTPIGTLVTVVGPAS